MAHMITIGAEPGIPAYIAQPATTSHGAVIVIHEVWGLNEHIKSIADRLAAAGYLALAPDLLTIAHLDTSQIAGLQEALFDPERRNAVQPKLREFMAPTQNPKFGAQTVRYLKQCFDYLYQLPESRQRVAVMGFCFGGTYSFKLTTSEPRLATAIAYYGYCDATVDELRQIKCPVQAFYGEQDERLVSQLPDLVERMKAASVNFQYKVYPHCGHAFFNDTNRFAYNAEAAKDSWQISLELLNRTMPA